MRKTSEVMDTIQDVLNEAKEYNLEIEVLATAFIALENDSSLTIEDALSIGLAEWDI